MARDSEGTGEAEGRELVRQLLVEGGEGIASRIACDGGNHRIWSYTIRGKAPRIEPS